MATACSISFFFFNDTATTEIYTLSLHDALPISSRKAWARARSTISIACQPSRCRRRSCRGDRKSTRLSSSHGYISYAVFCLKKKKRDKRRGRGTQTAAQHAPSERREGQ